MLYHLATILEKTHPFLRLFRYISTRSISAMFTAFVASLIIGKIFIKFASKNLTSKAREFTPSTHASKDYTPTMGGLFIILSFFLSTVLWSNLLSLNVRIFSLTLVTFGLIGCADDLAKINKLKGISARLKLSLQIISATAIVCLWMFLVSPPTTICIPFFKTISPDLGLWLIPWSVFVIVGTSNAVNLTDGLDGLVAGPLISSLLSYGIIAYLAGHPALAKYLAIPMAGTSELTICAASLIGALLGFLWYNANPAQIFMGDVGSLSLGAALGFLAIASRQELLLVIIGGIFVVEALSVILQVGSFKLSGKRIFKMAPIHHHFELKGWNETKVTIRFWIISLLLSLLALLTLKIR
jgi:phospho-N-acetylmuramoyl-pentapeptide-transferase